MAMAVVLQAASSSILLVPGFLPFFFIVQIYLAPPFPRERASVLMCFFVFLLGPLAACVAALQIGVLVSNRQNFFLIAIQAILQSFIEFSCKSVHSIQLSIAYSLALFFRRSSTDFTATYAFFLSGSQDGVVDFGEEH